MYFIFLPAIFRYLPVVCLCLFASSLFADLYAVTERGLVYRSDDDGLFWFSEGVVPAMQIVAMSPGATPGTLFILAERGDFYSSTDGGASWGLIGNVGASDCVDLVLGRNGVLVTLTKSGDIIRSMNNGSTWTVSSNIGSFNGIALSVGGESGGVDSLYAATSSGDLFRSSDGVAWSVAGNTGFTPLADLLWVDGILMALTDAGEVLRSTDSGANWNLTGVISQVGMRAITHVPNTGFLAITREGEVTESADGSSWIWTGSVNQVFIADLTPGIPEDDSGVGGQESSSRGLSFRAFPNPFADNLTLFFSENYANREVDVEVYDITGRRVAKLTRAGNVGPDTDLTWKSKATAPGVYFIQVRSGNQREIKNIVLLR